MTPRVRVVTIVATILTVTASGVLVHAQDDWPAWGRDAGNQRHSPLTQINTSNVSMLVPAWRYEMTKAGVPSRPSQSTPLMVEGVLYLSFPYYRVVALGPETGDVIWEYTAPGDWNSPEHQLHWTGGSMRGLAYWEGDDVTSPQIVFGTEEGELISLNAQTGIPNARFGNDGYVDLKTSEVMNGFPNMHYGISSGVAIYKHLVFTGVHNADETGSKGPAGDVRAWDLRTGELPWTFHIVPRPVTRPGSTTPDATSAVPTPGASSPSTRSAAFCTYRSDPPITISMASTAPGTTSSRTRS